VQCRRALEPGAVAGKALHRELFARLARQRVPSRGDFAEIGLPQQPPERAGVVVLDICVEQSERREKAGRRRYHNPGDAERRGHAGGEQRSVAAEGKQRELARVTAALRRNRLDGADHIGGGDQMGTVGRPLDPHAERLCDLLLEQRPSPFGI
jgi:hypothetical protein